MRNSGGLGLIEKSCSNITVSLIMKLYTWTLLVF